MQRDTDIVLSQHFTDYVASVNTKSEDLIRNVFPRKINELNKLLESNEFDITVQQKRVHEAVDVSRNDRVTGTNAVIAKHLATVKPFVRDLMEQTNILRLWINFLIPKIEDGNNSGVAIQEMTLEAIKEAEAAAEEFNNSITLYHISRGKLISKAGKYPQIQDYKKVVAELDENELFKLRILLTAVRNYYAAIYDLIGKNWEKIQKPRSSNLESLY